MNNILRYIMIIIISYIAISLGTARIFISNMDMNTKYIQELIKNSKNLNIEVDDIKGDWKGLYPSINLTLKSNGNKSQFQYPENIELKINIYKSIIYLKPVINSVYVENIYYKNSIEKIIKIFSENKNSDFVLVESINVKNSNFLIDYKNNVIDLKNTNISVNRNSIIIESNIDENKKLIAEVDNIKIKKNKILNLDYKFNIIGKFDYDFKKFLNKHNISIDDSNIKIIAQGSYQDNVFKNNKLHFNTIDESRIIIDKNEFINLDGDLIFTGDFKNFVNFELSNISFKSKNNNNYLINKSAFSINLINKNVSLFVNSIFLDSRKLYEDFIFSNTFKNNFLGNFENIVAKFNANSPINDFYISSDIRNANINTSSGYVKNFTGNIKSSNNFTDIYFDSKNVELSFNSFIRKTPYFDSVSGSIKINNYSSPDIYFSNLRFSDKNIDIAVYGNINNSEDSINIFSEINFVDMKNITDYMPASFISKKSSRWFKNAFKNGVANNARILINGNLKKYPFYSDYSGISYAIFPISNLDVDYKHGWIPFSGINGTAYFKKRNAFFMSEDFKVLNTYAKNPNIYIDNVKDAELEISGNLNGPINDLINYSNAASLTNISKDKLSSIDGETETKFYMKICFNGKENEYKSQIKLKNISYIINQKNILNKISGTIKYNNGNFFTKDGNYIEAKYNKKDIRINLETNKDKNFIVTGSQKLDIQEYVKNKILEKRIIGKSNWDYKIIIPGFQNKKDNILVSAKSKLNGTELIFPSPFRKNKLDNFNTVLKFNLIDGSPKNIKIKYNDLYAEFNDLENFVGYIDFSGRKQNIPKNNFSIYGTIEYLDLLEWKNIDYNKSNNNFLLNINTINLKFNKFKYKDFILNNFSIVGFNDGKHFIFTNINTNSNFLTLSSSGKVEFDNISTFKINLKSNNLENLLNLWKIEHGLRKSSVNAEFDINWKGGLFDYEIGKVDGKFSTNMLDGRIKKVGNRATRIFGLLNIDLLVKRLSLDFDDVTKNGFYFNSLNGDFRINNGNIFTTNLIIKGPSAELLTVGTTNIINETYDMQVIASPEFGDTLPAIALLGGPITAAATYAAEKLAKAFGKDINDLIKIKYKVTGTWDNPIIKIIKKDSSVFENIEDLFK